MRRSSRGNPWHDARGRFASGPSAGEFLGDHDQAYEDACRHFGTDNLEEVDETELEDWVAEHDQLQEDYERYSSKYMRSEKTADEYAERTKARTDQKEQYDEEFKENYSEALSKGDYDEAERLSDSYVAKYGFDEYRKARNEAMEKAEENDEYRKRLAEEDAYATEAEYGAEWKDINSQYVMTDDREDNTFSAALTNDKYNVQAVVHGDSESIYAFSDMVELGAERTAREHGYSFNGEHVDVRKNKDGEYEVRPQGWKKKDEYGKTKEAWVVGKGIHTEFHEEVHYPWQSDSRFAGNKNAKLLYLMATPNHPFNDRELIMDLKSCGERYGKNVPLLEKKQIQKRYGLDDYDWDEIYNG